MLTKNVATSKKRVFGRSDYKHKLEGSRDKKKGHSPYTPIFFGTGLAVVLLFAGVGVASAATYYVATDGSDSNPGTEAQPWRTIQKAADTLVAGDTIYIKEGTYNERVIPENSGSPGNYITYATYPGDTVIIDGSGFCVSMNGLFHIDNKDYIKVSGLAIQDYTDYGGCFGIFMENVCNHIIIENNNIKNIGGCGIFSWHGGTNIIIDNNEVSYTNLASDWDQEMISLTGVDGFEVKNNHVHNSSKIAIDVKGGTGGGCSNGKIYNNHVHHTRSGIYTDAWDDYEHNIDIYQNVVHDLDQNGYLAATEQGGTLENIRFFNNIGYNCGGFGFVMYGMPGPKKNIKIINNVFYNFNIRGIGIYPPNEDIENIIIRNNICSQNTGGQIVANQVNVIVDHNLIDGVTETYGDNPIIGDPKFINPAAGDFHLQADSPAIDNGSSINAPSVDFDENSRPQGAGYDISAYEFVVAGATGTISGTVTNTSFNPIQEATVTANEYSTTTDATGSYTITNIPIGNYTVTASATGYYSQTQENVEVLKGKTTTVNFQLTKKPSLVGEWHFDEGEGTTAVDSSEYRNDGTLFNGPAWVDGKVGKALSFDGVDDYVNCGHDASLDITDEITIMAWVYPTASSYDQWDAILGKGNSAYRLHMHDNQFDFGLSIVELPNQNLDAGSVFAQNQWAHVAATYNGTNMKIYINGALANSTAVSGAIKTNNYHLWIGGRSEDPKYFNGTIDEVKIYNRALTAEEIKADYEAGSEEKNPPARDTSPPLVTNPTATQATILLNDNSRPRAPGTNISQLNVTVTDDTEVDTVTIGLSPIGGSSEAQMTRIPGTDIWSVTVTATAGINLTHNLIVTATDVYGNSNTSVSIQLTVLRRGDVFRDNVVDRKDATYIARYLTGSEPEVPNLLLVGDVVGENGDPTGDGVVDMKDAAYIARYEAGFEDVP